VAAVVVTYRRPQLAGDVVRSLVDQDGLAPDRVVVVVNGTGGLDDPALEASVDVVRLPENLGPAGGFKAGMEAVFSDPSVRWAYLCQDDLGLYPLPAPRLADVVSRAESAGSHAAVPVGAVVAWGRRFVGRGSHAVNVVPPPGAPDDLTPVDVAGWGATLLSRAVYDAGVVPDPAWFYGLEDFDFFSRVRRAGFSVLLDGASARAVADLHTTAGRAAALGDRRPTDAHQPWRSYYTTRNSVLFVRRHGRPSWYLWQAAYSARHLQLATSRHERRAIVHGLWDGVRGRTGEYPAYTRDVGEYPAAEPGSSGADPRRVG
jgi:hypothetical protein